MYGGGAITRKGRKGVSEEKLKKKKKKKGKLPVLKKIHKNTHGIHFKDPIGVGFITNKKRRG